MSISLHFDSLPYILDNTSDKLTKLVICDGSRPKRACRVRLVKDGNQDGKSKDAFDGMKGGGVREGKAGTVRAIYELYS